MTARFGVGNHLKMLMHGRVHCAFSPISALPRARHRLPHQAAKPKSVQSGFTLLEVLVAFTIMAVSLGALFNLFGDGLRMAGAVDEYGVAATLAETKMASLGVEEPLTESEASGDFEGEGEGYSWRVNLIPYVWEDSNYMVDQDILAFLATVEVSWGNGSKTRTLKLTGLRLAREEP